MRDARASLRAPALVLVTDSARLTPGTEGAPARNLGRLLDALHTAVHAGVSVIQIREQALSHEELLRLCTQVRAIAGDRTRLFVNGDARVALASGADGLHLAAAGMNIAEARGICGDAMLISRAVHSVDAARHAEAEGADIVQFGTVFRTASKPGVTPVGIEGLRAACVAVTLPVIAIGGINSANATDVIAAGAAGIAVIGAILEAPDVRAATRGLRLAIEAARS